MIITLCIIGYILNVFLNRWIYFETVKIDAYTYPNPPAFACLFLSVLGTIVLVVIYIITVCELWSVKRTKKKNSIWDWFSTPVFLRTGTIYTDKLTEAKWKKQNQKI